ncbi:hypothetical protein N0V91_001872 [Didymella pomorum]|uniref:Xylanolytic transcriptional activator regulatory domain-containing protein n=1 Tax=Didymella pomorum TaxID=749634 RepID=A0A9W8ZN80_9PLEO|nr:hypothetical protein N0V91_001872 [Didymella pomorum]
MHKSPLPAADLLFDGSAYDLPWDGTRHLPESASPVIPSIDYAIFLINAVKFHCGQMMHLFEEEEFMTNLHIFYSSTGDKAVWKERLWYIHFLMVIAFGKTFVQQKNHSPRPPGAEFFVHALQLLPDTNRLCRDPVVATEVLCCIALYLQSLDSRNAAHVTIGQAMRIALIQGMHTDMPVMNLGEAVVQRCRKIWWTIFILDRHMTALMGLPQSIRDEDVSSLSSYLIDYADELETFLPWDLDALFVSTMVLIVTRFVDSTLLDERTLWLEQAFTLMDTMVAGGNRIADYRMRELRRLDEMLAEYAAIQERPPLVGTLNQQQLTQLNTNIIQTAAGAPNDPSHPNPVFASPDGGPLYSGFSDEGSGFGDDLTAEQILAVAESMDIEGTDWLSFGVFDNYQPLQPLDMVDPSIQ